MRAVSVTILILASALAGCVGGEPAAAPAEKPASRLAVTDADNATRQAVGSITGRVIDDELRPVANANVGLVEAKAEIKTDQAGAFDFDNVPVGDYTLVVDRLGYERSVTRIKVNAASATEVEVTLPILAVVEPYLSTIVHVAFHHIGEAQLDSMIQEYYPGACEACSFTFDTNHPAENILIEVLGRHTIANPQGDKEYVYLCKAEFEYGCSSAGLIVYGDKPLPVRIEVGAEDLGELTSFHFEALCELFWFCLQERRDIWVTSFHHMAMPEGYSAIPPE